MSNELFPLTAVTLKSPRLKWMERHGICTNSIESVAPEEKWIAWRGDDNSLLREGYLLEASGQLTYGSTESEALTRLCKNLGLKLWNEE